MKVQLKHRTVLPAIIQFRIISLYFRFSRHNICQTILKEEGRQSCGACACSTAPQ